MMNKKIHFKVQLLQIVFPVLLVYLLGNSMVYSAILPGLPGAKPKESETKTEVQDDKKVERIADDYDRGVPRSSVKGFLKAVDNGDFEEAEQYLDLRHLPKHMNTKDGKELAKQFKIVLDRSLWLDMDSISEQAKGKSDDGQPAYRDILGTLPAGNKKIEILLQRVPRGDGAYIWKFSNRTVANIPILYEYHGYSPLEEYLEGMFPDFIIFGWQSWQWATYFFLTVSSILLAWLLASVASYLVRRKDTPFTEKVGSFIKGPVCVSIWIILERAAIDYLGPSDSLRTLQQTGTLLYFVLTWTVVRSVDLGGFWFALMLEKKQRFAAIALLKPIKTVIKSIVIFTGLILWLENIGVHVGTLMASLGIGGFAVALAAQDMLKNLLGSIMILMDRPYEIGQRIVAKGKDGIVEEIGLRSTKIRMLNGHQATIPNEDMAKTDIENIGRRPHIRRSCNITIPLDTSVEKVKKAVSIIKQNLENHECMDERFPPRVHFNEFNRDSVNIQVIIWYASTDYWAYQAFNERINLNIMQQFEQEGIRFALPSFKTYSEQTGKFSESTGPLDQIAFNET